MQPPGLTIEEVSCMSKECKECYEEDKVLKEEYDVITAVVGAVITILLMVALFENIGPVM